MTISPIDMQVVVPRAGEVERVNRTVQGQQQTDQQILNQVIQENIQHQQQTVNDLNSVEQSKIQNDEGKKKKDKREQEKKETASPKENDAQANGELQSKEKKGRYIDIRI